MTEILRVKVEDARVRVSNGEALLVCAYDDPSAFRSVHLEGAMSLEEFRARMPSVDKGKEIIFYCA